jgi:pilus assembly protein CpaF
MAMATRTVRIYYSDRLTQQRYACDVELDLSDPLPIRVGASPEAEIVLPNPRLPDRAASIHLESGGWQVEATGMACTVGRAVLSPGRRARFEPGQELRVGEYTLTLDDLQTDAASAEELRERLDRMASEVIGATHKEVLTRLPRDLPLDTRERRDELLLRLEHDVDEIAGALLASNRPGLADHLAGHCLRSELLRELIDLTGPAALAGGGAGGRAAGCFWTDMASVVPELERDLGRLATAAARALRLRDDAVPIARRVERLEQGFWRFWSSRSGGLVDEGFRDYLALRAVKKDLKDTLFGFGPLEDLLRTPTVNEIMVNDSEHIFIEHGGAVKNSGRRFVSDEVTLAIMERIVAGVGRRIDKSQPMVDARLADGSRVNAVIPPLAVDGPCLTVRKFAEKGFDLDTLQAGGAITHSAAEFLTAAILCRKNIMVSGGTGTGKTTLLNALGQLIPADERIITIEDTAELRLRHPHVVRLETRDRNLEGQGAYTIRDLVRNALRMRPDRIIVGECRGGEALDMLQAMNTGHEGSMTTIHANSPRDVIGRLEVMVQAAADLPLPAIHRQIASGLDLIMHLELRAVVDAGGRRKIRRVKQVSELTGFDRKADVVRTRDLYSTDEATGRLRPTGCLPTFIEELVDRAGLQLETFYS